MHTTNPLKLTIVMGGCWLALATSPADAADAPLFVLESDAVYTTAFGDQFYGAVTAGPGEYFAVWVDLRVGGANPAGYDLYGQRILPDGTLGAPGSLELLRDMGRMTGGIPNVAWNGSVYLVVWNEGSTLFGMRVAPDGEVIDPAGFIIGTVSTSLAWPSVASDGTDFLVVQPSGSSVLAWRVFPDDGVASAPITISSGATGLGYPKVTFGGGQYLVAWAQAPNQAIRAARVMPDGTVLDPGGFNVSGGGTDVDSHVDFDGQNFYVVWERRDGQAWDIWGAHVTPQGQVVSGPNLLLDGNTWGGVYSCQVAFNGTDHLIAITSNEPVFSNTDLYALRVSAGGSPLGGPFPVSTLEGQSQTSYGIASVGDQFFIIWEYDQIGGVSFVYDTEGARISAQGQVLDWPQPIKVSTSAAWQVASTIAFDGENFLAAFEDWRPGGGIAALRVTPDGVPLEARAQSIGTTAQGLAEQPDAVAGGGQFAVVFENRRGAVSEVRMVRIAPDGTLLDPSSRLIFRNEATADTFRPKIAWNGQHYCVVWNDSYLLPGQKPLQFAIVDVDGTVLTGPVNVPGSDGAGLRDFEITSDGDKFMIGWIDYDSVNATRISDAGVVINTRIVRSHGNWITELPVIAWNGETYLLAWRQYGPDGVRVFAQQLDPTGLPINSLITVAGPSTLCHAVEIGVVGGKFVVTGWSQVGNTFQMFAAVYGADGEWIETTDLSTLSRNETYAGTSAGFAPDGTMLVVHSLWTSNPYNSPRATGQVFNLAPPQPGDLDNDGDIDLADLAILLASFGTCAGDAHYNEAADLDSSGCVELVDLTTLLSIFGTL